MYCIVDIETTGGKYNEEGIIEIALYKHNGKHVIDQFSSLVNTDIPIQNFVINLTGITYKMIRRAPKFQEIAKRIIQLTQDCILVTHNANFDYRMLCLEFNRLGYKYVRDILCTIELSKKLLSKQPSYKLEKLSKSLGIIITDKHRAYGDAKAVVSLFELLLEKDLGKDIISKSIKSKRERITKILDDIPTVEGIFYIHNKGGDTIYIGQSYNIHRELYKIFLNYSIKRQNIQKETHHISYHITGNPVISQIKVSEEIIKSKPKYNRQRKQKKVHIKFPYDNMLLLSKGRKIGEQTFIWIKNNRPIGYGYFDIEFITTKHEVLKNISVPITNTYHAQKVIRPYLCKNFFNIKVL